MKKLFICAAVAVLCSTSCNKEDVIEFQNVSIDNTIKVEAIINGSTLTKAFIRTTEQDSLQSFKMYMYNDGKTVADGIKFSKPSEEGNPWTHDDIYYWAAGKYAFYGVAQDNSADNAISDISVSDTGIIIGTSTSPYVIATDGKTDEPKWDGTAYKGGIYESAVTSVSQPDPVVAADTVRRSPDNMGGQISTMNFYHILSRIRVKFDNYNPNTSKLKLVVLGYEFRQVGVEGYTANPIVSASDASSVAWTVKTKGMVRENSIDCPSEYSVVWTKSYKNLIPKDSWCNVIPGDVAVALVCKVAIYDDTNNFVAVRYLTTSSDDVMKAAGLKLPGESAYAYRPGFQYTYKVQITSDGGADTDYPKNPGLDDPYHDGPDDDLEGLMIKVAAVTVKEWQDAAGGTAVFTGAE